MLSFDITDRHLKIVKAAHTGGKIKITNSATFDIDSDLISDGLVNDTKVLADSLGTFLKDNSLWDKEAVASISSTQIVFKELQIPKAKGNQFMTMVQNQMLHSMGVSDKYSISYTIVGDADEKGNSVKVLATACPYELVDSYKELFSVLGITLKAVNVSCNCVTRIVLADPKIKDKMPLLAVQVDNNCLNLNLYENNQLAFSRYVLISEEDYGTDDYVNEALNENIFRMIQFNKSRGGDGIKNVYLYGDVKDYIRITNNLEPLDIRTNILSVPGQITGFENFEFTHFVNAIGALFKRKKETERINLLEIDSSSGRKGSGSGFAKTIVAVFMAAAVFVSAAFFVLDLADKKIVNETDKINAYLNDPATQQNLELSNRINSSIGKIQAYNTSVQNAKDALNILPRADSEMFQVILDAAGKDNTIESLTYTSATINLNVTTSKQEFPSNFIEKLEQSEYFANVIYNGFNGEDRVEYNIVLVKKAGE